MRRRIKEKTIELLLFGAALVSVFTTLAIVAILVYECCPGAGSRASQNSLSGSRIFRHCSK
jgi:ABC-type phosphate transport system permease subunit